MAEETNRLAAAPDTIARTLLIPGRARHRPQIREFHDATACQIPLQRVPHGLADRFWYL